jgi:hypothetical protein
MTAWMSRLESASSDQGRNRRLIRVQQAIRKTPEALVGVKWRGCRSPVIG